VSIFHRERSLADIFLAANMHELLRLNPEYGTRDLATILLFLFSYKPEKVSPEFLQGIAQLATAIPKDILTFVNLFKYELYICWLSFT
jgi:hypothetical protein